MTDQDEVPMDFKRLKEETAQDCEQLAEMLKELAGQVREGDIDTFLGFFYTSGTEEGDAKIQELRERILIRYYHRREELDKASAEVPKEETAPDQGT